MQPKFPDAKQEHEFRLAVKPTSIHKIYVFPQHIATKLGLKDPTECTPAVAACCTTCSLHRHCWLPVCWFPRYTGHAFRGTGATAMMFGGAPDNMIELIGGWAKDSSAV